MKNSGERKAIVILGHTGFLGNCLYEHLSKNTAYKVFGFSSAQIDLSSYESTLKLRGLIDSGAAVIMSASALIKSKDPLAFKKEISMFVNLSNAELLSKISHFILISSIMIYGRRSDFTITEFSQPKPDDFYSYAKLIGELIFSQACINRGTPLTIVRPSIFYGLGDTRSLLFRFINNVQLGREIEMYGDDSTRLSWIYIKDLCRAIELICQDFKIGDYNIVSDENGISLVDLAELVFKACRLRTGIKSLSSSQVSPNLKFDTSKFKIDFPGFTFTKMEDGIKDYF